MHERKHIAVTRPFRLGLVGLDTSHPRRWLPLIRELAEAEIVNVEVVAAWDSGETQPKGFAEAFCREKGIAASPPTLDEMVERVDGVIIHTANWDHHVDHARVFAEADKTVFIDKPVFGCLADLRVLEEWVASGKRVTGGSGLRFAAEIHEYLALSELERGTLHTVFGGCGTDEFFYGIHGYAMLCGLLGPGLQAVEAISSPASGPLLAKLDWDDGRTGILSLAGPAKLPFHVTAVSTTGAAQMTIDPSGIYRYLLARCLPYLCRQSDDPPLALEEWVEPELAAIAVDRSRQRRGERVALADLTLDDQPYDGTAFARQYRMARTPT